MYIKNLTLRGFKTFADKTVIELDPLGGITAIVGPNGCGKSNILDAVRWVLGEQGSKSLRIDNLEQVIFAGTSQRKPLSLAEVSLLMDNSDGVLHTEFSEVDIRRRVFRDAESEFFLNKSACRLKDIRDLFLDTGLGAGAYSIISQGQVDAILSSKPEERRAIFEEAAGINKYKFRKEAAERKLIATEQTLLRVKDLRKEITDNLAVLEKQSTDAREYKALKDRVRFLDICLCKYQGQDFWIKKKGAEERISQLKLRLEQVAQELASLQEQKKAFKQELLALEEKEVNERSAVIPAEEQDLKKNILQKEDELSSLRNHIRDLEEQERFASSNLARDRQNRDRNHLRIEKIANELILLANQVDEKNHKLNQGSDFLSGESPDINKIEIELNALILSLRDLQENERLHQMEISRLQENLKAKSLRCENLSSSLQKWQAVANEKISQVGKLQEQLERIADIAEGENVLEVALQKITFVWEKIKTWEQDASLLKEEIPSVLQELHKGIVRLETAVKGKSDKKKQEIEKELEGLKMDLVALKVKMEGALAEEKSLDLEVIPLEKLLADNLQKIENIKNQQGPLRQQIEALQTKARFLKDQSVEREKLKLDLVSLKVKKDSLGSESAKLQEDQLFLSQAIESAEKKLTQLFQDKTVLLQDKITQEETAKQMRQVLQEKEDLRRQKIQELFIARGAIEKKIDTCENQLNALAAEEKESTAEISRLEISLTRWEGELNTLSSRVLEEYGLSQQDVLDFQGEIDSISKAKKEAETSRHRMRQLEPVNLLAIEEYEKIKERSAFIDSQWGDLDSARLNLRSLITELDLKAQQSFDQTIEEVSRNFSEIFSLLFVGGEAKLVLSQGESTFDTGVEIMVRPAGKKFVTLSLLSGGERALTAIALLFALLKTHPSPFCFLDEVDAPLDEANIIRFTKLLKNFAASTQMIVITHNKRTMAVADTLYGITMEEPGVSKIISIQFEKITSFPEESLVLVESN